MYLKGEENAGDIPGVPGAANSFDHDLSLLQMDFQQMPQWGVRHGIPQHVFVPVKA